MKVNSNTLPQRIEREGKPLLPKMKWAQSRTTAYLGIEIFNMKFHRVQLNSDAVLTFFGVGKPDSNGQQQIYEFTERLSENIVHEKSGQKVVAGWLQLYLRKIEPPQAPYPPPNYPKDLPPPPKQMPYVKFWPFIFKNRELEKSKRIIVDWDKWQDEDAEKDAMNDFDPEKLIELMKKNGEWDEEDDEAYGPEALKRMQENPEEDLGDDGEELPPDICDEEGNVDQEKLYRYQQKKQQAQGGGGMMEQMMQGKEPEKDSGPPTKIGADEDFLFEKYLRSGEYLDITKRRRQWRDEQDEDAELGMDEIMFKSDSSKRQKLS